MSCSCGDKWEVHTTVFETREERMAAGKPVDNIAMGGEGYAAMGGITGFSSLLPGVDRQDASGIGAPDWAATYASLENGTYPNQRDDSAAMVLPSQQPRQKKSQPGAAAAAAVPQAIPLSVTGKKKSLPSLKVEADDAAEVPHESLSARAGSTGRSWKEREEELTKMLDEQGLTSQERMVLTRKLALLKANKQREQAQSSIAISSSSSSSSSSKVHPHPTVSRQ